ncbi:hypothetical protein D1BOALGB6SA_985 [Olavius sp. associated proteobacterium Delta 1]|nr:hypothetical protein D1BOALGB6SA_985 [Olavius sp. associated proteobacterium Delta 1]
MYLFFVRHFNDIDHLTPVAWKLQRDNYRVAVYCMSLRYDIHQDYRLRFLKEQGVAVDYLYEAFDETLGPVHKILYAIIRRSYRAQNQLLLNINGPSGPLLGVLSRGAGLLGSMFYKLARKIYYDHRWARSVLERSGAQVVCFDYIMPRLFVVDAFLKASRRMSIPSVALPHGVQLYTNEVTKPKATDARRFAKFNRFDFIIAPNKLRKDMLVKSGVAEDKISVLGSARYCSAWLEQNHKILPEAGAAFSRNSAKLKVVLMPSKPQCQLDMERMFASCRLIAERSGIEAVIKPHPRTRKIDQFGNYPLPDVSYMLTAKLCEWADVLLVVGSSVITEALMRGKPALYLKYLHANTTLFEELNACWTIHNEDELKQALASLEADRTGVPYDEANVAKFIAQVVRGGDDRRDVLSAYEQFIASCAAGKIPGARQ